MKDVEIQYRTPDCGECGCQLQSCSGCGRSFVLEPGWDVVWCDDGDEHYCEDCGDDMND